MVARSDDFQVLKDAIFQVRTLDEQAAIASERIRGLAGLGRRLLEPIAPFTTEVKAEKAQRSIPFVESEIEKQAKIVLAAERDRLELIRAQAVEDRARIAAAQEELAVKQKVTKELREANPALAGQLEAQIRINAQAAREGDLRRQNNEIGRDAFRTINDGIIESIKNGETFSQVLRKMTAQLIEMATRAAVLKPLEGAFSKSFGGILSGLGFNAENGLLGNLFGSTTTSTGGWATTVTPSLSSLFGFAAGGIFETPVQVMAGGRRAQMGENGPEAIVPLRRGSDGRLGVSMLGGAQTAAQPINFTFNVAGDMTDQTAERVRQICKTEVQRATPGMINASVQAVQRENVRNPNYMRR
jgi:hypothetical protein